MEIQQIICPACGAPLSVGETTVRVTCSYCRTPLTLHRQSTPAGASSAPAVLPAIPALPDLGATARPTTLPGASPVRMTWWRLLLLFDGRITRVQFWLGVVMVVALLLLASGLSSRQLDPTTGEIVLKGNLLTTLLALAGFWMLAAVSVKRLRDRGKSAWWALLYLVPFGVIWLLVELGLLPRKT